MRTEKMLMCMLVFILLATTAYAVQNLVIRSGGITLMTVDGANGNMNLTGYLNATGTISEGGIQLTYKYLELTDSFGGDVSGTYDAIVVDFTEAYDAIDNNITQVRTDMWKLSNFTGAFNDIYNISDSSLIYNGSDVSFVNVTATTFYGDGSALTGISIPGAYKFENFSVDYTTYGGFKLENVSYIDDNITQIWTNITSINNTLGQKADRSEVTSGEFIANGTDASLKWLNVTTINVTNVVYGLVGNAINFSGGDIVIELG